MHLKVFDKICRRRLNPYPPLIVFYWSGWVGAQRSENGTEMEIVVTLYIWEAVTVNWTSLLCFMSARDRTSRTRPYHEYTYLSIHEWSQLSCMIYVLFYNKMQSFTLACLSFVYKKYFLPHLHMFILGALFNLIYS